MDTSHSHDSFSAPATGLNFLGAMDQKPYGAMLRGKLTCAALQLAPRNLDDTPPIANTTTGAGATRAALRAQVEHDNKLKQESKIKNLEK
eukprot:2557954-Pleurochrysis_carterae.AAC.1